MPEDMKVSIGYYNRMNRGRVEVSSEAGRARKMMFISDKPGKYTGYGDCVK